MMQESTCKHSIVIWLDRNVENAENRGYARKWRRDPRFDIRPFSDSAQAVAEVISLFESGQRRLPIIVITSGSDGEEFLGRVFDYVDRVSAASRHIEREHVVLVL
jgi:hypothetical protein